MNRRKVIAGIGLASAGAFAGGVFLFEALKTDPPVAPSTTSSEPPLVRPHSPVLGPADAPVTIVEFLDPACEACRAFHPIVKQIMAKFPEKVRVVVRYAAFHPTSEEAIRILEAARAQDKFEPVLERLFETQPRWAPHGRPADSAWNVLDGTGLLYIAKARLDAQAPDIVGTLNMDAADVRAAGVSKTPTFFVNGKPLAKFGAQELYDLVEDEVAGF